MYKSHEDWRWIICLSRTIYGDVGKRPSRMALCWQRKSLSMRKSRKSTRRKKCRALDLGFLMSCLVQDRNQTKPWRSGNHFRKQDFGATNWKRGRTTSKQYNDRHLLALHLILNRTEHLEHRERNAANIWRKGQGGRAERDVDEEGKESEFQVPCRGVCSDPRRPQSLSSFLWS